MFRKLLITFILILILPKITTLAQEPSPMPTPDPIDLITFDSINPGSPYYIFKRIIESFTLNFLTFGDQNKAKYSEKLLDNRLHELAYIVKNNLIGILDNAARRYTNQAGLIIEKYQKIDQNYKSQAKTYMPILNRLRDQYPANSAQWLMIQESVDTTRRIAEN